MKTDSQLPADAPQKPFERLCWIMDRLLAPDGCPWDMEQTHQSIKQYLIEESYEVCDAIDSENWSELKEELGDVGLQVVFHAAMARSAGRFDVDEVYQAICDKLVRRHPHVFGSAVANDSEAVLENWEKIKQAERQNKAVDESRIAGIPLALPALQKAHRMQGKAARSGFDWPDMQPVLEKVHEEFNEVAQAIEEKQEQRVKEELGDLLFAIVNVSRRLNVQPEEALQAACARFDKRFRHVENCAKQTGQELENMRLEEMDAFWDEAKRLENK